MNNHISTISDDEKVSKKELALNKAGATREAGAKAIAEALGATKVVVVDKFGSTTEEPDHLVRLKAEEMRARYVGDLKEISVDNRTVNINTTGVSVEAVKDIINMIASVKLQLDGLRESGSQTGEIIDISSDCG